jgi:hypothetical protein
VELLLTFCPPACPEPVEGPAPSILIFGFGLLVLSFQLFCYLIGVIPKLIIYLIPHLLNIYVLPFFIFIEKIGAGSISPTNNTTDPAAHVNGSWLAAAYG